MWLYILLYLFKNFIKIFCKFKTNKRDIKYFDKKKIQSQNQYKDFFNKIINYILLFKSFIIKITLIGLLIKIFRKYSLLRKLWTILNWIILSLFGLSITDIYGSDFISDIISYWRSTQFYSWLSQLLGYKVDDIKETPSRLKSIDIPTTTNQKASEESNRLIEWFDRIRGKESEIEIIEDDNSNLMYYIIGGVIIIVCGCFMYVYWDEITIEGAQVLNWFRALFRRPGSDGTGNGGTNIGRPTVLPESESMNIPGNTNTASSSTNQNIQTINQEDETLYSRFKHNLDLWKRGNKLDLSLFSEDIETIDNTSPETSSSDATQYNKYFKESMEVIKDQMVDKGKGKAVLTSPSLENLSSQVEESWSNSKPSSPRSDDSIETIKPINIPKNKDESIPSSENESSSQESIQSTSESTKQFSSLFIEGSRIPKPFLDLTKIGRNPNINNDNFKKYIKTEILERMNWIEYIFSDEFHENDLTKEIGNQLAVELANIDVSYEVLARKYAEHKGAINAEPLNPDLEKAAKEVSFFMRKWLNEYHSKILSNAENNIIIGNTTDSPKSLFKIFEQS